MTLGKLICSQIPYPPALSEVGWGSSSDKPHKLGAFCFVTAEDSHISLEISYTHLLRSSAMRTKLKKKQNVPDYEMTRTHETFTDFKA